MIFFFIVLFFFAQSEIYLATLYHDDKTNDHVSTTNIIHQYVYYNMYCTLNIEIFIFVNMVGQLPIAPEFTAEVRREGLMNIVF